jgi:hypothetical protein
MSGVSWDLLLVNMKDKWPEAREELAMEICGATLVISFCLFSRGMEGSIDVSTK